MICASCSQNKAEVHPKRSAVAPAQTILKCNSCIEKKLEPRYLIIIYGRRNGFDSVSEFIKQRRYVGNDILASEFT